LDFSSDKCREMKDNLRSNLNLLPNEIVKKFNSSGIFNLPDNNKIPSNSEILEEILSFSKFKDLTKFFNLLSENTINSIKQLFEITQPNLTIDNLLYELLKHKLTVVNTYQLILDNGDINESSKDPITTNNITSKRSIEISSDDDIVPQIPKKLKKKKKKEKEKKKKKKRGKKKKGKKKKKKKKKKKE